MDKAQSQIAAAAKVRTGDPFCGSPELVLCPSFFLLIALDAFVHGFANNKAMYFYPLPHQPFRCDFQQGKIPTVFKVSRQRIS